MKKALGLSAVLLLVVAACSPSTSEPVATDPPAASTTESPGTTSAPAATTTAPPAATTSTIDQKEALDEAKANMVQPELASGGILEADGAFVESTEGFTPFDGFEIYVYDSGEHLNFYIEGPGDFIRSVVIEFDALDADGAVVSDTSYVGDQAVNPPPWAVEAQNGNTVRAADFPLPETTSSKAMRVAYTRPIQASGERLGAHIKSRISLDQFIGISMWIYAPKPSGQIDYANRKAARDDLLAHSSNSLLAAAFFVNAFGVDFGELNWLTPPGD